MKIPEWIVFDVGGVIIDITRYRSDFYGKVAKEFGHTPEQIEEIYNRNSHAWYRGTASVSFLFQGLSENTEEIEAMVNMYLQSRIVMKDSMHRPVVVDAIHVLKDAGFKLAILSNIGKELIEFPVYGYEVEPFSLFDVFVDSYKTGFIKPEPEIFSYFFNEIKALPENCLFIDDTLVNVEASENAGMSAFLFKEETFIDELEKYTGIKVKNNVVM